MPPRSEALLQAYTRELSALRKTGSQFASRYPKIASRLQLDGDGSADPHVERLIEAFAFLTARVQVNIDNDLPELTTGLLGQLYPHFVEPVPSMSIAQFVPDASQGLPLGGFDVPRHTSLFAEALTGEVCRFRTAYPVSLWPIEVADVRVESPRKYEFLDRYRDAASVIRIRLEARDASFRALELSKLRFFLGSETPSALGLYELLTCNLLRVAIVPDQDSRHVAFQPATALRPVGFARDEAVLNRPAHAHRGYGFLQEYFAFPEKFLFFDLELGNQHVRKADGAIELLLLLDAVPSDRLTIDQSSFALGCTPVVNLFPKTAEPIRLDHRKTEYELVADYRSQNVRVHSIVAMSSASDLADRGGIMEPFFSYRHSPRGDESKAYWWAQRRRVYVNGVPDTEIALSFLDMNFTPKLPANETVFAHTLCTNGELATQVPPGGTLSIEEAAPVSRIFLHRRPTASLEPPIGGAALWQLVSLLSLNHNSLTNSEIGLDAFREILRLHDFSANAVSEPQVRGITGLATKEVMRQMGGDAWRGFCRGIEVTLTVDESLFIGSSAILLSSVLSQFLGLYASVNSFMQLAVRSARRQGTWKLWPPMAGEQTVL